MGIAKKLLILFVVFSLGICLLSCARNGQIGDVIVMDDTSSVMVFARFQNLVKEDTEKIVYAGVPITCTFYIKFYQERPYWFDRRLTEMVVRNAIKYDNVKKEILLTTQLNGREISRVEFDDFGAAQAALFDLNGVSVFNVKALSPEGSYHVAIKARIEKDERSHLVRYILFFLPFTGKETDWYRKEFVWKK
jgi:hypothetical protein